MRCPRFVSTVRNLVFAAVTLAAIGPAPARGQQLDDEVILTGGATRLERPSGLAVSPEGEQIAIADAQANRIVVIDYRGEPLWTAGDRAALKQPYAVAFADESRLLFLTSESSTIFGVSRENPTEIDTVTSLSLVTGRDLRVEQLLRETSGTWLVLDSKKGEVLRFDADWKFLEVVVPHGSGKGMVLVPTSMTVLSGGRLVVTDERNYPAQAFARDGKFLFHLGWNSPTFERGWEASAAAVDNRGMVWVSDATNYRFRVFDPAGTQIGTVAWPNPAFRPVAMTGTVDNRMMVLGEFGVAAYYTLR